MSYHRIGKHGEKYWGKRGAGILFTDGEKVLLLKRSEKSDQPSTWSLPGGKSKKGESAINTAVRETQEETGLKDIPGRRIEEFESRDGMHRFATFIFKVTSPFDVELSDEHTEWGWVPLDRLDQIDLHPKLRDDIPRYTRSIQNKIQNSFREWLSYKG